jgi:hypothetical protein
MTELIKNNDSVGIWWQIEIEDNSFLSGGATANLLSLISIEEELQYAAVLSLEGANVSLLNSDKNKYVFPIEELISTLDNIAQVDWGDFFLTKDKNQASLICKEESYPESLSKCSVLVRAVDDTYFYVYGKQVKLKAVLEEAFPGSVSKYGSPETLDYPE